MIVLVSTVVVENDALRRKFVTRRAKMLDRWLDGAAFCPDVASLASSSAISLDGMAIGPYMMFSPSLNRYFYDMEHPEGKLPIYRLVWVSEPLPDGAGW